jgi:hypothetical protein
MANRCTTLPYPLSNVGTVVRVYTQQDYYQIRRKYRKWRRHLEAVHFWNFVKAAVQWLAKAGWRPLFLTGLRIELEVAIGGRIGLFLGTLEAGYWGYKAYPYIRSYFDPPKALEELRQKVTMIIMSSSGGPQQMACLAIRSGRQTISDNIVPIPTLKHWEINGWLDEKTRNSKTPTAMS